MSDRPTVPVCPQALDVLRQRYPAAVTEVVDALAVQRGARLSPSTDPRHVFDTLDGLRLIISREQMPNGRIVIHFSASFHDLDRAVAEHGSNAGLLLWVLETWRIIAQSNAAAELVRVSHGGVPHFIVEQVN